MTGDDDDALARPGPAALMRERAQSPESPADKQLWGDGPWQNEPDRVEWLNSGLPCVLSRHPNYGSWLGYVGVPPGHPWHGVERENLQHVEAHGGITFAGKARMHIRSLSNPKRFDEHWWIGFDTNHGLDLMPAMEAMMRAFGVQPLAVASFETYRDMRYCGAECDRLATQALIASRQLP